jgi:hypothetical protein
MAVLRAGGSASRHWISGFTVGVVMGIVVDELFQTEETYGRSLPANHLLAVGPGECSVFLDLTPLRHESRWGRRRGGGDSSRNGLSIFVRRMAMAYSARAP